jgi:TetR/AcrR family transcriptional regulator, cholesterol catabolism regulator
MAGAFLELILVICQNVSMVRLAVARPPARPSTAHQVARQERMLRAAARLGSRLPLDRVQMAEVAAEAGVAIGTLYRYYPSKHHLFAGLLTARMSGLEPPTARGPAGAADLVGGACRALLARPLLARAMITSVNVVRAGQAAQGDTTLRDLIAMVAGTDDLALARIIEQTAYGVLTWAAAGEVTPQQAEADIRRACALLLA